MGYGQTFEDVNKINTPDSVSYPWGTLTNGTKTGRYALYRVVLDAGGVQPLHFHPQGAGRLFVASGDVIFRSLDIEGQLKVCRVPEGKVVPIPAHLVYGLSSEGRAVAYFAGDPVDDLRAVPVETRAAAVAAVKALGAVAPGGEDTSDVREKYWGRIETFCTGDTSAKRLLVLKDAKGSMEFHVEKTETYWVHSGLLKVGLRVGRAENRSFLLKAGESYDIYPGVMHLRTAIEDTVIIEAGTRDSDADSHLVEDGQTYTHIDSV
jgi:mannose-6-phosphate isomerase-like protein (cupin superfamily)